uniref:Uncharacterized protein n=1 Tax=Rhizophagus irregularis (strain DAOM 181602 / DAOM 197198 / MUCL 43194) TaxID=747089 RepID=U9T3N3_RHIID
MLAKDGFGSVPESLLIFVEFPVTTLADQDRWLNRCLKELHLQEEGAAHGSLR